MKAKILKPADHAAWEKFLKGSPLATIHQTPLWGEFQAKIPYRGQSWIVALMDEDKIIGGTMLIRHTLPKGLTWLYAGRGPLVDYTQPEQLTALIDAIKPIAKKENSLFLRIDPPLPELPPLPGFKATKHGFQPEHTLILDLTQSEEELLAGMKQKGRYNVRLAQKKDLKIIKADPKSAEFQTQVAHFYQCLADTTTRDGFSGHKQDYYQTMLTTLGPKNAQLYLAYHKDTPIAGLIITYCGTTATYYYGASSNAHRNLMAPYLLQWTAICDAKKSGYTNYDFLGVAPPNSPSHPWHGVTQFKLKFGGTRHSYAPAQEYPFKKLTYSAYRLYKKLR